jgi:hypothetical protein
VEQRPTRATTLRPSPTRLSLAIVYAFVVFLDEGDRVTKQAASGVLVAAKPGGVVRLLFVHTMIVSCSRSSTRRLLVCCLTAGTGMR